ncbi:hypothetical protein FSP39_009750 [Pinctada imbricata]|uniref:Hexosyltransferase n=1 Tax=Pinctada imbricata TaxID=66713 RepID=A0AA89C108_PINIB|nr:hypothetical protein FSP39_009750 [Pinctada imbricata]
MKLVPRTIFSILLSLSVITFLWIAKCGTEIDNLRAESESKYGPDTLKTRELFSSQRDEAGRRYQLQMQELKEKIKSLEAALEKEKQSRGNMTIKSEDKSYIPPSISKNNDSLKQYLREKLQAAEISHGVEMKSEYELTAFNRFTLNRIYLVEPGLGKRVVEKPIGQKKKDLGEVITYGVELLNKGRKNSSRLYTVSDFIEGIYRTEPVSGTQYELYYRNLNNSGLGKYTRVIILRPFGPLIPALSSPIYTDTVWINLILPLKGRIDSFKLFMKNFVEVCILQDKKVFLTVVYFGSDNLATIKSIITNVSKTHNFKYLKLVNVNEDFSRGRALQIGIMNWKSGDVLLFMCDVDIIFNVDFLERCRLNTERTKRVYYPMVFSLYNPKVVYSLQGKTIPSEREQLIISKQTGFWRDFGYGMTCQYRSDFYSLGGFDEQITGWGGEDVALYKKYIKSNFIVVRATDPGIFHLWHDKFCDPTLSADQYQGCIRSKALNEASHAQLGLLAFKDEIDIHKGHKQRTGDKPSTFFSKQT